ncbi:hypothetical protein TEA_020329 [Camellia sinensis var. sinensis]|uniref:Uncharacterized protein n=1 Tax=Camellia sinensis var. sinensis TaxID=542762 RepID=A0A4S4CZI3_CAMSN|nr:hypothetical protein TEA_020329 [Camellia sinensis var. sinensis]
MVRNDDHFPDGAIPAEIAVNLNEFLPEFDDLNFEELLNYQECVYQSLQGYGRSNDRRSYTGQSSNSSQLSGHEGQSSTHGSLDLQLALDEALARSLQLEDNFDDFNISQSTSTATGSIGHIFSLYSTPFESQKQWNPKGLAYWVQLGAGSCAPSRSQVQLLLGNREVSSRETPATPVNRNVTQDDIDPDNMTYEASL